MFAKDNFRVRIKSIQLKESISDSPIGINVNEIRINNIGYADDTVKAYGANYLQTLLDKVNAENQRLGLKINICRAISRAVKPNVGLLVETIFYIPEYL